MCNDETVTTKLVKKMSYVQVGKVLDISCHPYTDTV